MRQFIESVKRLYDAGEIGDVIILSLHQKGKITEAEKVYIFNQCDSE